MAATDDFALRQQAADLEQLMPALMRTLFRLDEGDALVELPLAQLRLCTLLQAGPRPVSRVAEELGTSVSAVTQVAQKLEQAGLVERVSDPGDRRCRILALSPHGADLMAARRARRLDRAARSLAQLPEELRARLLEDLRRLLDSASREPGPRTG